MNASNGNGDLRLRTPGGFEGQVKGSWGAILLLVTTALVLLLIGVGWAAYVFNDSLKNIVQTNKQSHDAIESLLWQIKYAEEQSQCLLSLPAEGEARLAALRAESGPCYYALYVYTPKSNIPPARPRPDLRHPGVSSHERLDRPELPASPARPTYPVTGFPADGKP